MSFLFKISLPGYDVKTATPEQCSVHSDYDSLKVKLDVDNPQEGNVLVTFNDNPSAGTYQIFQVKHGYGYIPAYYFFFDVFSSNANTGIEVGNKFPTDALYAGYFQAVVDKQTLTFNYVTDGTDTVSGNYYAFRYYIFANDGI